MSTFIGCNSNYEDSDIVIFGAPFDGTTTFRPGARFAPSQIRQDSYALETYSPYFDIDIKSLNIYDSGDIEIPFGATETALELIEDYLAEIFKANKKPLMIGGEHLVTLPAVKTAHKKYDDLHVLHFDAHTDLREQYMGISLSHSGVIRSIWDFLGDNRIYQFGIRSGTKDEFVFAEKGHVTLNKYDFNGLDSAVKRIGNSPVYLTVDLDVLDPSVFPGTGTPEPGGVTFKELIDALLSLKWINIIAADVVELSPHYDNSACSTACACKVIREVLCLL